MLSLPIGAHQPPTCEKFNICEYFSTQDRGSTSEQTND